MEKQTVNQTPNWIKSDALTDFIDELKEAGYKIGVSEYITAQKLILALIARGEVLDSPANLSTMLGPIFCSSPTEQDDFQQRFNDWVNSLRETHQLSEEIKQVPEEKVKDVKAQDLSKELGNIRIQHAHGKKIVALLSASAIGLTAIILLAMLLKPSQTLPEQKPIPSKPIGTPSEQKPTPSKPIGTPSEQKPIPLAQTPVFDVWQLVLIVFLLTPAVYVAFFVIWRLWWDRRAQQFLQRLAVPHEPELQKISIQEFEQNLFPNILFTQVARGLKNRIRVPSNQIDVNKTIDTTLRQGGWLSPVYGTSQTPLEYLFLVDSASFRDHQTRFFEEMIDRLKQDGVLIKVYFFDGDPRICFGTDHKSSPKKLPEIINQYHNSCLIIVSDTDQFFSAINGELEPWVDQLKTWEKRAVLTPNPVGNWSNQELFLAQHFIVLPASLKGLQVLSQVLNPEITKSYVLSGQIQTPLPELLLTQPYRWIERDPPAPEQIDAMLKLIEQYLGKQGYYWLGACAIFPELHWNITIYLGSLLTTEEGQPLIEVCSPVSLARLPWFRYGYMPDWLRVRLILSLTPKQESVIRSALHNLLISAVQGSVNKQQLEVATQYQNLLSELMNPILRLLTKRASQGSPLRDYLFLSFMTGKPVLASKVPEEFRRLLNGPTRALETSSQGSEPSGAETKSPRPWSGMSRRQALILSASSLGAVGIGAGIWALLKPKPQRVEFKVVTVDAKGQIVKTENRQADIFKANLGNSIVLDMASIPSGSFQMGSPPTESERSASESPQHQVTVPAFWMGIYAITQAQWKVVASWAKVKNDLDADPSSFKGSNRPVENISWDDAVEFCARLSKQIGREYRLPSEAEWEYACRAGTKTPFYFGETITPELANYYGDATYGSGPKGQYRQQTTEVGSFPPNAFGLYDMHGNVWEWCLDHWHENYQGAATKGSAWVTGGDADRRVLRGGSWSSYPWYCRSAGRHGFYPADRTYHNGFRVVCSSAWTL